MDSNRCFLLAINAGMINVLGLVTVLHQSVSHMTGNISMLAMSLINWEPSSVLYLILVVLCYVTGSFYSGLILEIVTFSLDAVMVCHLVWLRYSFSCAGYCYPISHDMLYCGPVLQWACKMQWLAIIKVQSFALPTYQGIN